MIITMFEYFSELMYINEQWSIIINRQLLL